MLLLSLECLYKNIFPKEQTLRLQQQRKNRQPAPRLTVGRTEGAAMLSMSPDHFDRHVASELRVIRSGRRKLYLTREIETWAEQNAARTLS
jgi:hypothetical protein